MTAPFVTLASPFHDPDERLLAIIEEHGRKLLALYDGNAVISASAKTSPKVIQILKDQGFSLRKQSATENPQVGNNYISALRMSTQKPGAIVHLVDFDRALHWVMRFPRELRDVVKLLAAYKGYVSFTRTTRSFQSHPQVQRSTESVVNAIASEVSGMEIDIMSGAYGFQKNLVAKIIKESKRRDYGIYAEFLTIALKHKCLLSTIEVEGLEWETPDQYQEEISRDGYTAWLNEFESLPEWKKRVALLEKSTDVLIES